MKGKGWTLVVVHPKAKVDEIKELIGKIKDKQEKHAPPVSKSDNEKSAILPHERLQWVPKR